MIRIIRPNQVPDILKTEGALATASMLERAAKGDFEFDISSDIYGHKSVKSALLSAHHAKCAFCESKFDYISFGDVEHFRPKSGVTSSSGSLAKPGYFWLGYTWSNLLISCEICNRSYKRNHFPVQGKRATYLSQDLTSEDPLLIDPAADDPSLHIEFIGSLPHGKTTKGRETIKILGLDREKMCSHRRDVATDILNYLNLAARFLLLSSAKQATDEVDYRETLSDLSSFIASKSLDSSEYACMARSLISQHPIQDLLSNNA